MQDASELEYVGFWLRVWASIIDSVLLLLVLLPVLYGLYGSERLAQGVVMEGTPGFLLGYVLPAVVILWFWSSKHATPGKMAIGARIVDARTGANPTLKQHVIRYLGYFLSTFFLCIGFLWAGFDRRKQGWHDKLAGTVVVRNMRGTSEPVRFG
ncbi:RDD family protein [Lacisediminimonas profundi]|uniref:RDD family protein n=1 Tax=Lacisediminimonas profundi TaxID=2603856 RepID=UPI00124B451A|nr:RDD family protein [Lacisediminimonas profundi]